MPRYEFLCAFVTLVIPTRGPRDAALLAISKQEESIPLSLDELTAFVNEHNRTCQFAPCWSASELSALRPLGLHSCDFCVIRNGGRVAASGALWDQRQFKQTVIRGYTPWLALTRPAYNVLAQVTKHPQFPAIGDVVAGAFVSHLASRTDAARPLIDLIGTLRALANRRGIQLLTLGFAANDPRLATVRDRFRNREYRSRLYVVHWQGIGGSACALDGRISAPEVALL